MQDYLMRYVMGFLFWLKNIVLWLDQGLNVLLMGDPDETLSRRAGRARAKGYAWGCYLCRVLDWIDKRHCAKSILGDHEHEGNNSVPQMVARWRRGEDPTWTPHIITLGDNQVVTIDYSKVRIAGEPIVNLGEIYSPEQLQKLIDSTGSNVKAGGKK